MKILVCGGRNYADAIAVKRTLDEFRSRVSLVIQGGARGADDLAKQWANLAGVHCAEVPALWKVHKRAAGHLRNAAMLELRPDICIAFPGGPGTADMMRACVKQGILVIKAGKSPFG